MIQVSQVVETSLAGLIRDFGLKMESTVAGPLWSSCRVQGKGVVLEFYIEEPDHLSDCRVVVDGVDEFDCSSIERLVCGESGIAREIKRKAEKYRNERTADLLALADFHCDFITVHLWPLFDGKRPETPSYLLRPSQDSRSLKESMIACWIKTHDKKKPNKAPEPTRGTGAVLFFQSRWPRVAQL